MKPDSIIFDMDGTLWDNVNSYEIVWNFGLEKMGFERRINRNELIGMMGKEARAILNAVIPHESEATQDELYEIVLSAQKRLIESSKVGTDFRILGAYARQYLLEGLREV